ncbi:hypothetical protein [Roseovarius litorisediminis]|uniref:hypothetical protein n=1 Tax=Roseovarius litorisediminis TaxID=1312363 RepID=UPI001593F7BC|nr:hypothetical protein [Roseovarius litorisediminis]
MNFLSIFISAASFPAFPFVGAGLADPADFKTGRTDRPRKEHASQKITSGLKAGYVGLLSLPGLDHYMLWLVDLLAQSGVFTHRRSTKNFCKIAEKTIDWSRPDAGVHGSVIHLTTRSKTTGLLINPERCYFRQVYAETLVSHAALIFAKRRIGLLNEALPKKKSLTR